MDLSLGAVQMSMTPDIGRNLDTAERLVRDAAALRTAEMFAEEAAQGRLKLPAR